MKYLLRPLTRKMIDQLKAGHAIETSEQGRNICTNKDFQYTLRALYRRGFIDTKTIFVSNKKILKVNITDEGKSFLKHYKET